MTAGPGLKTLDQWIDELERALNADTNREEARLLNESLITVPCDEGLIEARRATPGDPWTISYPWGDDHFYGTSNEVRRRIKDRLALETTDDDQDDQQQ